MNTPQNVIPVLLGGDLNAYSVALSFKARYNINSHVFARYRCGATENSRFITTHLCSGIADFNVALPELLYFASKNPDSKLILIPCSDSYIPLIYTIKDAISELYDFILPKEEHYKMLTDKAEFQKTLEKHKIGTPKTVIISKGEDYREALRGARYPAVIKPSSSEKYYKHIFTGMKKVYFPESEGEGLEIIERIFASGYEGKILLQEKISSKATNYVLTTLSDRKGEVIRASLGKVILEERGDSSYGNYSAIITEPLDMMCLSIIKKLNKLAYVGIANFDIMRLGNDFYCLELNARQGRSCDYLRAGGISLAEYFLENALFENSIKCDFSYREALWHYPKFRTVMNNIETEGEIERAYRLYREGKSYSPFENGYEGLAKRLYKIVHDIRLEKSFRGVRE